MVGDEISFVGDVVGACVPGCREFWFVLDCDSIEINAVVGIYSRCGTRWYGFVIEYPGIGCMRTIIKVHAKQETRSFFAGSKGNKPNKQYEQHATHKHQATC